ncbi:MAG: hemin uptake protein HemP [Alphaproteobacteria bacterium]|nr:hemin uptake protein HemP [Alphaproteobacteria bacterium]
MTQIRADVSGRAAPIKIYPSEELLSGAREVIIDHDGKHYRLRSTKNGKLILTK